MELTHDNLKNEINEVFKENDIYIENYDDDFLDYGMDSISFITLILHLEKTFCCEIPDEYLLFSKMNSVNKIFDILYEQEEKNDE